jgi:hypothetical protein
MTENNSKNEGRKMMRVAIVETDVYGVKAYHARCLECGWESKRKDREVQAVADAKKHYPCLSVFGPRRILKEKNL